jgi:predicted membrane-bound spermidine synthase
LTALFFLSGASALIYQVLWLRLLSLVFGVTVYAASTVLASFMSGLALGSFLAGRVADRLTNPLRFLGLVEALMCLLSPALRPSRSKSFGSAFSWFSSPSAATPSPPCWPPFWAVLPREALS